MKNKWIIYKHFGTRNEICTNIRKRLKRHEICLVEIRPILRDTNYSSINKASKNLKLTKETVNKRKLNKHTYDDKSLKIWDIKPRI